MRRSRLVGAAVVLLLLAVVALAAWWCASRDAGEGEEVAKKKAAKVYVVQKLLWIYDDRSVPMREPEPAGAGLPERAFADRGKAEERCRELNRAARSEYQHPFQYGRRWGKSFPSLHDFTSVPTGEFIAWLGREGIDPPKGQKKAWEKWAKQPEHARQFDQESYDAWWSWWNETAGWTDEKRAKVWDKLDKVRFYEVIEVEAEL